MVVATVHNTGGRAIDMNGTLKLLAGPGGLSAGPFPATLGTTVAIGDAEAVTIVLDKWLPAGPWDAQLTLHSGLLERSAAATITFAHTRTSPSTTIPSPRSRWLYPATAGLVILLLAVAVLVITLRRRPRAIA
jgi:hypothetical protein